MWEQQRVKQNLFCAVKRQIYVCYDTVSTRLLAIPLVLNEYIQKNIIRINK